MRFLIQASSNNLIISNCKELIMQITKKKIVRRIVMVVLLICTAFLVCSIVKNPFGEHDVMLALAITAGFIALEKLEKEQKDK
ncbi:MAG: hypothetical protein UHN47_17085 [Lachnospiraceae bacterium]|nr:hypothetical protein [Lachnospiraceae bacterium]